MSLDAIIISEAGTSSFSATNPLKLTLEGRVADIQVVSNYLENDGRVVNPIQGDGTMSWASAPKLNGIILYNILTRHRFHVALINSFYDEKQNFDRRIAETPKAVIISTTFINDKETLRKLVENIRRAAPDVLIVAGGPFVYSSYRYLLRSREDGYISDPEKKQALFLEVGEEPDVDLYVVSQRGEIILCDILSRLKSGRRLDDIPNTARREGNGYRFARRLDDVAGVNDEPVDWAALPDAVFRSGVITLQASTGCPFHCAFCNFIKDHRLNGIKPLDRIVSEMNAVARRGIRYVWFVDDNFRLGKKDLGEVCRRFIDEGLSLNWMTFVRADALANEDLGLLKEAGCREVQLGLESADPGVLRKMNKQADPQCYSDVLIGLRSAGIHCSCYFIFGFPGETAETAQRTRDFIKTHDRMDLEGEIAFSLFPFILNPLSPIFEPEQRRRHGLTGYMKDWKHTGMDSDRALEEIVQTFLEMQRAGAIYRGDNQEMLSGLGTQMRRDFLAARNSLARAELEGRCTGEMTRRVFRDIFGNRV